MNMIFPPRVSRAGFPTGVENMGGALQNLMGRLESIHGGSMGGLKKSFGKHL